jgi:hypothetical protein
LVIVHQQPKKKDTQVPPEMAERKRPVSFENRIVVVIGVLRSVVHGTLRPRSLRTQKIIAGVLSPWVFISRERKLVAILVVPGHHVKVIPIYPPDIIEPQVSVYELRFDHRGLALRQAVPRIVPLLHSRSSHFGGQRSRRFAAFIHSWNRAEPDSLRGRSHSQYRLIGAIALVDFQSHSLDPHHRFSPESPVPK